MKKSILILSLLICSCSDKKQPVLTKPFYVENKFDGSVFSNGGLIHYKIIDKNGNEFYFADRIDKYNVGDTIK